MHRRFEERARPRRPVAQDERALADADRAGEQRGSGAAGGGRQPRRARPCSSTSAAGRRRSARGHDASTVRGAGAYESGHSRRALELRERLVTSPATAREILPDIVWNIAATRARLGDVDGAMTDAMTYGQYRPQEQQQLFDRINQIRGGR